MSEDWNDHADAWDDNSDVRLYAAEAFAALDSHVNLRGENWRSRRVLDFGCGTGLLAQKIAPHVKDVVAVDTADKMIAVLKNKRLPNVRAVHADILSGDASAGGDGFTDFDLIYASSVCGFLPDYIGAVKSLVALLSDGGRFVQWDWQASGDDGSGLTELQIEQALTSARLRAITVRRVFEMKGCGQAMPVLMGTGTRAVD